MMIRRDNCFFRLMMLGFLMIQFFWVSACEAWASKKVEHVVIISVDGLRADAISVLGEKYLPNMFNLMLNGVYTLNARTDPDFTVTMPNHVSILTGRGVTGSQGHGYMDNASSRNSIHRNKGVYVSSIFDAAKKRGLSTGFYATKDKFQVFINSYVHPSKEHSDSRIDEYMINERDSVVVDALIARMRNHPLQLAFLHLSSTDKIGHKYGWDIQASSRYSKALRNVDQLLGKLVNAIKSNPQLADSTVIFLTTDHGGSQKHHQDHTKIEHFRIPLIIWGKGVARQKDLYKINTKIRQDPGDVQVPYTTQMQPIRNADVANCALSLLGLEVIDGSTIGNPDVIQVSDNE